VGDAGPADAIVLEWRADVGSSSRLASALLLIFLPLVCAEAQAPFAEESASMFTTYDYGLNVKLFCIEPERPLPDKFLRRFSGNKIRVVWASDCELSSVSMNGVREKKTGQQGLRMTVTSIRWITRSEAEAKVEAFSDGIAANWNTLRVVLKSGRWVVESDETDAVS
jgi:hypothetical protein